MNTLFKNKGKIKRRRHDINIHKAMQIPVNIYQSNKLFFGLVQPKNACKLEFADHLWLPYLDKTQYDIIDFAIITYQIYNILVTKWKHRIGTNDIISLNEILEILST